MQSELLSGVIGLGGACVGGAAAVAAQMLNHQAIQRRVDRDRRRAAYVDFADAAIRFIQRAELALIFDHNRIRPSETSGVPKDLHEEHKQLVLTAGAVQDELTAALCQVTMHRGDASRLDTGADLFGALMAIPMETSDKPGESLDEAMLKLARLREAVHQWLREQARLMG